MSRVSRKPVFEVSDQVRHKPGYCTIMKQKQRRWLAALLPCSFRICKKLMTRLIWCILDVNWKIFLLFLNFKNLCCGCSLYFARRYSSVGSDVAWESKGTAIDPHFRHIFSRRFGHENISMAILSLQEEHLSVNGEKMCAKYWLPVSGRLAQEQCG